jgi:hypothetical protein
LSNPSTAGYLTLPFFFPGELFVKTLMYFFLAGSALLAAPMTRVTLINSGHPLLGDGSYYVGPYTLQINGRNESVLCIDFVDQSKPGAQWNAYLSMLGGNLASTYHPAELVQYREEAYLFSLITERNADRVDIQHAAWAILDTAYKANKAAEKWVVEAEQNYQTINPGAFEIISEAPGEKGPREQEFIGAVAVPEPALLSLLAGLMMISLSLIGRRRN